MRRLRTLGDLTPEPGEPVCCGSIERSRAMFQVVARNFSILTVTQVVGAGITFLYIAFAARRLGPTHFGMYILIVTYVRVASVIVNAGVTPIAFRELASHREDPLELFNDIVSLRLGLGITSYMTLMAVMFLLHEDPVLLSLLAIAATTLALDPFNESYAAYYTAHERVGTPSAYGLVSTVLESAAGIALLLAGLGLKALFVSQVLTGLLMTTIWTVAFRSKILSFTLGVRPAGWWRLLALTVPFAPIYLCNQLNRVLNVVLLGHLSGPIPMEKSVGYYGPAQSITNAVLNLVMSLRRVLIPPVTVKLSQGYAVTREINLALKLVTAVFALPLLLGTAFVAPELVTLLFGKSYAPSATALTILGWGGALQIAALAPETFLFAHPNHTMQDYVGGALTSVLVNVGVSVLLIASYGFVGAAVGAVTGRLVYFLYVAHYSRQKVGSDGLRLKQFGDLTLLLVSEFALWYLTFALIANAWLACAVAVIPTLVLVAAFILYLRPRSVTPLESLDSGVRAPDSPSRRERISGLE